MRGTHHPRTPGPAAATTSGTCTSTPLGTRRPPFASPLTAEASLVRVRRPPTLCPPIRLPCLLRPFLASARASLRGAPPPVETSSPGLGAVGFSGGPDRVLSAGEDGDVCVRPLARPYDVDHVGVHAHASCCAPHPRGLLTGGPTHAIAPRLLPLLPLLLEMFRCHPSSLFALLASQKRCATACSAFAATVPKYRCVSDVRSHSSSKCSKETAPHSLPPYDAPCTPVGTDLPVDTGRDGAVRLWDPRHNNHETRSAALVQGKTGPVLQLGSFTHLPHLVHVLHSPLHNEKTTKAHLALWDLRRGLLPLRAHTTVHDYALGDSVEAAARLEVAGSVRGETHRDDGHLIWTLPPREDWRAVEGAGDEVVRARAVPDSSGVLIVETSARELLAWHVHADRLLWKIRAWPRAPWALAPDGSSLYLGGPSDDQAAPYSISAMPTPKMNSDMRFNSSHIRETLLRHRYPPTAIGVSDDGVVLASGDCSGRMNDCSASRSPFCIDFEVPPRARSREDPSRTATKSRRLL